MGHHLLGWGASEMEQCQLQLPGPVAIYKYCSVAIIKKPIMQTMSRPLANFNHSNLKKKSEIKSVELKKKLSSDLQQSNKKNWKIDEIYSNEWDYIYLNQYVKCTILLKVTCMS